MINILINSINFVRIHYIISYYIIIVLYNKVNLMYKNLQCIKHLIKADHKIQYN